MTATDIAIAEGYTVPAAGRGIRSRLKSLRFFIVTALALMVILVLAIAQAEPTSPADLSIRNPEPFGAMATGEILRDQGVRVDEITYLSHINIADPTTTTFAIVLPANLSESQIGSILDYPGDLVFIGSSWDLVSALGNGLQFSSIEADAQVAGCDDPDATAAGYTTAVSPRIRAQSTSDSKVCFADSDGFGTYVRLEWDGRLILIITDPAIAMNANMAEEGNAALVLRSLGKNPKLVWYIGALDDVTTFIDPTSPGPNPPDSITVKPGFLPAGTGDALFALGLAGLVAALWKGRRMGPLVTEPLPVIVHASESERGRGRLYQRARAYGRASSALRASTAERMGRRLGIPRSAAAPALIGAVAGASGRDPTAIERLLYGPPPSSETDMMVLAQELDTLEREVHRS